MARTFVRVLCIVLALATASACSINTIQHTKVKPTKIQRDGKVTVARKATGLTGGRVGFGRFPIFAIPVVPIRIDGDERLQIMASVQAALQAAGYNVDKSRAFSVLDAAHIKVHVNKLRFNNYTPLIIPLVPTWGIIKVHLRLEDKDGALIWDKEIEGRGSSLKFWDGYNSASRKAMHRLVKNMSESFASEEFYQASQRIKRFNNFSEDDVEIKRIEADPPFQQAEP